MPWFPVPFILIEPPNKKTDEYEYNQVSWTNNTYSPAIKRLLITQDSSYWYYDGYGFEWQAGSTSNWITEVTPYSDLSQTHPPKKTITDIPATVIRASMIPSDYPKTYYTMKYVLKFKANPNSKNKVVRFCSSRQEKIVKDVTRREVLRGWQWMMLSGYETTAAYTGMYIKQGENAVITNELIEGIDFEKLIFYEQGSNWNDNKYHGLATRTYYNICTVDLSKPGSYAYLVFEIGHANTREDRIKPFFDNGQQADCSCFLSMQLDKENDIIFGEGFSLLYLGETLVDAGMINMGENAPTEIYIGENLVWSN